MTSVRLLLFVCLAGAFCFPAAIAAPRDQKEITQLYQRGLAGDADAVEECISKLEAVLQAEPANYLARVYLGSAYTLRSRDLGFGPRKLQALKQGLAVMDEAVAAAPNEPKIRLARALTTSALPGLFGRGAESRKDFLLLAKSAEASTSRLGAGDLQMIYYQAGLAAKSQGDREQANALLQKALQHGDDAALMRKVRSALATL